MPMRTDLQISDVRLNDRQSAMGEVWSWIAATVTNPEFGMVALFCAVGLWLTLLALSALATLEGARRLLDARPRGAVPR